MLSVSRASHPAFSSQCSPYTCSKNIMRRGPSLLFAPEHQFFVAVSASPDRTREMQVAGCFRTCVSNLFLGALDGLVGNHSWGALLWRWFLNSLETCTFRTVMAPLQRKRPLSVLRIISFCPQIIKAHSGLRTSALQQLC